MGIKCAQEPDLHLKLSFPVTSIMQGDLAPPHLPIPQEKLLFCYRATLQAIDAFLTGKYTDFDAHTISTCCHGMALLTREILYSNFEIDMQELKREGIAKINELQSGDQPCTWSIPESVINLARLHLLAHIKETDYQKGIRTAKKKLKLISPLGTRSCEKIVENLQKHFANQVAHRYSQYLENIDGQLPINGIPVKTWGKYIQPHFFRTDMYGILYTSNLFSMQVCLAYLIQTRAKVAVVNDIISPSGETIDRQVFLFQGNGHQMELLTAPQFHTAEPIVVFGGCAYLKNDYDKIVFSQRLKPWLNQMTSLILACDVFYPQFPKMADDLTFDSTPIHPEEDQLQEVIDRHLHVKGVSSLDPSLFCLSHIYPASIGQILNTDLPVSFIPGNKMNLTAVS